MKIIGDKPNLFAKTRYSLAEEDRVVVVNGLLIVLQHSPPSLGHNFLNYIGTPVHHRDKPIIREHIPCGPDFIIDGEILVTGKLIIGIEAEIHANQFTDSKQSDRYFDVLRQRPEPIRVLLLLSPDSKEPPIVAHLPGQNR